MKLSIYTPGEEPEKVARLALRNNSSGQIDVVLVNQRGLAITDGYLLTFTLNDGKLVVSRRLGVNKGFVHVTADGEIRLEENR